MVVREGNVLSSRNVKTEMFGLGITPMENFLASFTQFTFFIIRLVTGNGVMVAVDMCRKRLIMAE